VLNTVDLSKNRIATLEGAEQHPSLEELWLSYCQVRDLTAHEHKHLFYTVGVHLAGVRLLVAVVGCNGVFACVIPIHWLFKALCVHSCMVITISGGCCTA
jgi:hypothetical protein